MVDEGGDKVQRFKKWFWSIVEKMSPSERQDLVRTLTHSTCTFAFTICGQCVSKNDTDVAHYNFNAHQPILVICSRDVAERVCQGYRVNVTGTMTGYTKPTKCVFVGGPPLIKKQSNS